MAAFVVPICHGYSQEAVSFPHINSVEVADCATSACLCFDFALSWPSLNVTVH